MTNEVKVSSAYRAVHYFNFDEKNLYILEVPIKATIDELIENVKFIYDQVLLTKKEEMKKAKETAEKQNETVNEKNQPIDKKDDLKVDDKVST